MRSRLKTAALVVGIAVAAACSKPSADEHFQKANAFFEESRLADAILEYRLAVQADPKRGDIRQKLAAAYVREGDGANARKEYIRAADLLPNDVQAQLKAGNILLLANSFEDAKTRANNALALDPKNADAQVLLGNALAGLKDLDGAVAEYQEALALNPAQDSAYLSIGAIQLVKGKRDEAEGSFKKAVEVAPKSGTARMALANFFWASGRAREAEDALKQALALDPDSLATNRALGVFYVASNRANEAEPYFKKIADTQKTSDARISLADYYALARRFDESRTILKTLAQNPDTYATATTRLAAVDATQGQRAQALTKLREVLVKHPKHAAAHLLAARLLLLEGKRGEAMVDANAVVADEPQSTAASEAYLLIGGIQASLDRTQDAIKAYEEVLKRQVRPVAANLALASLHLDLGSLDKATTYVKSARSLDPSSPAARALEIRLLLVQRNLSKAKEQLAPLQKAFPNSPTVLNLLATAQWEEGRVDAARASFAKARELAPYDAQALAGLVGIDLTTGRVKDAISRVDAALKTMPATGTVLMLAGQAYSAGGDLQKAEETLKRAIDAEPARLKAYGLLGGLYAKQRRLDDARNQFQKIVDRDPNSVSANTMLGMIFEAQQRLSEAEQQYQKVLALDTKAPVAANNLAYIYVASNRNLDRALELAQTAKQAMAEEPHVNDTLGWIYYRKHMASTAIQYLEASVKADASDPMTHYHLGMAYAQWGEKEKARQALKRALAFNRPFDGVDEARKTLAQIGS